MATVAADKLTTYREQIEEILREYASHKYAHGDIEREIVIDPARDHYELISVGWLGAERVHGCLLHVDFKNGKIWIQHDGTEVGIAKLLVEAGVPKEDIVLAFHSPFKRQFTGFAVE
jgi:hypothetical protein